MSLDIELYYDVVGLDEHHSVYERNITHNLFRMADVAGFGKALWHPDQMHVRRAHELAVYIRSGLAVMVSEPAKFKKYDTSNGWGTYDQFIPWLIDLLEACVKYPHAHVAAYR